MLTSSNFYCTFHVTIAIRLNSTEENRVVSVAKRIGVSATALGREGLNRVLSEFEHSGTVEFGVGGQHEPDEQPRSGTWESTKVTPSAVPTA